MVKKNFVQSVLCLFVTVQSLVQGVWITLNEFFSKHQNCTLELGEEGTQRHIIQ